jgi:hypothetical protein
MKYNRKHAINEDNESQLNPTSLLKSPLPGDSEMCHFRSKFSEVFKLQQPTVNSILRPVSHCGDPVSILGQLRLEFVVHKVALRQDFSE